MGDVFLEFIGFVENAKLQDLLSKVSFVEWSLEDCFVEALELGKSELRGKQFKPNGLISNLSFEASKARIDYLVVVEGKFRQVLDVEPSRARCIRSCMRQV